MKLLKNRTVLGILCIVFSLLICFLVTPLFNKTISQKTEIVRVQKDIRAGDEITKDKVQIVEVGGYNLPMDTIKDLESVVGAYTTADLLPGDYILHSKISAQPPGKDNYLYQLDGSKQAISVTVKSFAAGLSGKVQSGDIVSIIAPDYRKMGETVIPQELQYVQVLAVTASTGVDANTGTEDNEKEKPLPATLTLLATPIQCRVLAELETEGNLHAALVYRGKAETARQFIEVQDQLLELLYPTEEGTEEEDAIEGKDATEEEDTIRKDAVTKEQERENTDEEQTTETKEEGNA